MVTPRDYPIEVLMGAVVLILVLGGVVGTLMWHFFFGLKSTETSLILEAGGVIATTLLIGAYLLVISQEYRRSQRQRKTLLIHDVIEQFIEPARDRAYRNRTELDGARNVDWSSGQLLDDFQSLSRDLPAGAMEIDRFQELYPDLYEDLERHDNELRSELVSRGRGIYRELLGPISRFVEQNSLTIEDGGVVEPKEVVNIIVTGGSIGREHLYFDLWLHHDDEFAKVAEEAGVDLEAFDEFREKYSDFCHNIFIRLGQARDELREEFPIHMQRIRENREG